MWMHMLFGDMGARARVRDEIWYLIRLFLENVKPSVDTYPQVYIRQSSFLSSLKGVSSHKYKGYRNPACEWQN